MGAKGMPTDTGPFEHIRNLHVGAALAFAFVRDFASGTQAA